jgi:hypothetical protein
MNNRELVALVYIGLFVTIVLAMRSVRPALLEVLKLLILSKIGITLVIYVATTVVAIWLMSLIGFWTVSLLGSTLLWFILVGFAWFINIADAGKDPDFFKRRLIAAIGIAAFLEVFVNLATLPLWVEFIVQGFLLFVLLLDTVASMDPKHQAVAKLTSGILVVGGLVLLIYTIVRLIQNWNTLDLRDVLNQFLLPIWLTVAAIPALYAIGLFMGYESLLMHMSFWNDRRRPRFRAIAGVAFELRGALVDINQFRGLPAKKASRTHSFRNARRAVRDFKRGRAADRAARAQARQRLIDNAGVKGTDSAGLQFDRREFTETKDALRWLATCHMGWYQRDDRPNTYRRDLLEVLGEFSQQGLPEPHGIVMKVRKDGQAWYAYRTTPSGYTFGIGASEEPPSQWFWDGSRPPSGYPSKKLGWTSSMEPDRPEWREEART